MNNPLILEDSTITLPDGRTLAYSEYGDAAGPPIIFFHGTPNMRWFYPGLLMGVASSARVIAFDRPGYGGSDFSTEAGLLGGAEDVTHLADTLGLGRFAVVGYSGGGPCAAAYAYRRPDRVTALGLVSSPAPPEQGQVATASNEGWPAFLAEFERQHPDDGGAWLVNVLKNPPADWPAVDRGILARPELQAVLPTIVPEGFRQGPRAWAWDEWLQSRPWDFSVADLAVPTTVWQGEQDPIVPIAQGRYLAATIPGAQSHCDPDGGHFYSFAHWNAILAALTG